MKRAKTRFQSCEMTKRLATCTVIFTLCKPVFRNQLKYCNIHVEWKLRVNGGGGYGLEVPCQYSFKGNSLAVNWLSERIAKGRMIVEDALARNRERKTGSKKGSSKETH